MAGAVPGTTRAVRSRRRQRDDVTDALGSVAEFSIGPEQPRSLNGGVLFWSRPQGSSPPNEEALQSKEGVDQARCPHRAIEMP